VAVDADVAAVSAPTVAAATVLAVERVGKNVVVFRGCWSVYCEKISGDDYVTVIYLHQHFHSFELLIPSLPHNDNSLIDE